MDELLPRMRILSISTKPSQYNVSRHVVLRKAAADTTTARRSQHLLGCWDNKRTHTLIAPLHSIPFWLEAALQILRSTIHNGHQESHHPQGQHGQEHHQESHQMLPCLVSTDPGFKHHRHIRYQTLRIPVVLLEDNARIQDDNARILSTKFTSGRIMPGSSLNPAAVVLEVQQQRPHTAMS